MAIKTSETKNVGRNVLVQTKGRTLLIMVDMEADGTVSKSGKSMVVATTNGNVDIPGSDLKLGLNIYRRA
jgi:hypothetical protein